MSGHLKLHSIAREVVDCRAAWAAVPHATTGVHIHHELLIEWLREPIEQRISYILRVKPESQQALRLRLMRPVNSMVWQEYKKIEASETRKLLRFREIAWSAAQIGFMENPVLTVAMATAKKEREEHLWVGMLAKSKQILVSAHLPLCIPDCPWNGVSIFEGVS